MVGDGGDPAQRVVAIAVARAVRRPGADTTRRNVRYC
jgi:hypothetical protein